MTRTIVHGCNGKMGRVLAATIARTDDIQVVAGVDAAVDAAGDAGGAEDERGFPVYSSLAEVKETADVVIDFTMPQALPGLLETAKARKLAAVIATTGLGEAEYALLEEAAAVIPVFQAANMSLGVNLLRELIKQAAAVLGPAFDIEIVEKHHNTKRDAPSGTALALADTLKASLDRHVEYVFGRKEKDKLREKAEIGIHAVRGGNIVGEHDVIFAGQDERLTIAHAAYSKALFSVGAVQAACFVHGRAPGYYHMEDMIAESSTVTNLYTREEALVSFKRIPARLGTSHNIFSAFSDEGINIDMISQTVTDEGFHSLSFSIDNGDRAAAEKVLEELKAANGELDGSLFTGLCKITVEGIGMETQSGVASAVFGILDEMDVESKAVTTSETKISLIIETAKRDKVIQLVKSRYDL